VQEAGARFSILAAKEISVKKYGVKLSEAELIVARNERKYPVIDGLPVMLVAEREQTMEIARASIERAKGKPDVVDGRAPEYYLETLGISDAEKEQLLLLAATKSSKVDPVVAVIIGATSGYAYKHMIGDIEEYPFPAISLPGGDSWLLLDIGCNWGRWSASASKKGYRVVGIDPSPARKPVRAGIN